MKGTLTHTIARHYASRRTRRAADAAVHPEFLFVQPFDAGSWAPKEGEADTYVLTLGGAAANTVYFSDRPERIVGLCPTQLFLDALGFTPTNPPNAALVAQTDTGEQDILVIELLNPAWDGNGTLTYDAKVLADYGDPGLAHLSRQQVDFEMAGSFGDGGLFIDGCPDGVATCYQVSNDERVVVGEIWNVGCHWASSACELDEENPSASSYGQLCHDAFPDSCEYDEGNGQTSWNCYVEDVMCRSSS
jgi:hypothetical protein